MAVIYRYHRYLDHKYSFLSRKRGGEGGGGEGYEVKKITKNNKGIGHKFS